MLGPGGVQNCLSTLHQSTIVKQIAKKNDVMLGYRIFVDYGFGLELLCLGREAEGRERLLVVGGSRGQRGKHDRLRVAGQ